MKKIDTHQHLLYPEVLPYSWADEFPALQGAFTLEDYWHAAEGTGVSGTLFMEVDVDEGYSEKEAQYFYLMAEQSAQNMLGVIASGRPEKDGFEAYLDAIAHEKLKGVRRVLHTQPDTLISNATLQKNLQVLGAQDLPFDLCVQQKQLPLLSDLVASCCNTTFILDHCGAPDIANQEWEAWSVEIKKLAERENLHCKISGIVAYASADMLTAESLRPYVETVIEAFGWERVVWGGDWPVCNLTSSISKWVSLLDEILESEDEANLTKLYSGNARRIYTLD